MLVRVLGPRHGHFVAVSTVAVGSFGDAHIGEYRIYTAKPATGLERGAVTEGHAAQQFPNMRHALDAAEDAAFAALERLPRRQDDLSAVGEPLHGIAYVSTASRQLTADDLMMLLEKARERNARYQVTGALLYDKGHFMQYIEGPACHLELIYRVVRKDPLHHGVVDFLQAPIAHRTFGEWSMGFEAGPQDRWASRGMEPILARLPDSLPVQLLRGFLARR